jgi:hypothetical protein
LKAMVSSSVSVLLDLEGSIGVLSVFVCGDFLCGKMHFVSVSLLGFQKDFS